MSHIFVIYRNDDTQQFPMYRTTNGDMAVMIFRTESAAEEFIIRKGMLDEWRVVSFTTTDTIQWLQDCKDNNGATEIALDPHPVVSRLPDSTSVIPIDALLDQLTADKDA